MIVRILDKGQFIETNSMGEVAYLNGGNVASSNVKVEERALEDLPCSLRLVGRHFMTGLVDTCERKVAVLSNLAANVCIVDNYICVTSRAEFFCKLVFDCEGKAFATVPIACCVIALVN